MAPTTGNVCLPLSLTLLLICMVPSLTPIPLFQPNDILHASTSFCVVLFPDEALTGGAHQLLNTLVNVSFVNESNVVLFGRFNKVPESWPNGRPLKIVGNVPRDDLMNSVLLFKKIKRDRTCLLMPEDKLQVTPAVEAFKLPADNVAYDASLVVEFINGNCITFRDKDGVLNMAGIHRQEILENLFTTSVFKDHDSLKQCFESTETVQSNEFCKKNNKAIAESFEAGKIYSNNYLHDAGNYQECERIEMPTASYFFHEYLSRSKPVIITGATRHWPAFQKWTNKFLRENYGNKKVHIKITPDGQYEGVEPINIWDDHKKFEIPKSVYEKLPYPDLVVVRPASMEIQFSEFLDLIEYISSGKVKNMSAYLEYSSISDYFPELKEDIEEMQFFTKTLKLKHLNIWLSDGNTLGKLHFDPFDNFLCQISGEKQVILFEPHDNTRLYEAHIQEAMLTYNKEESIFYRKKLLDSTSMVMSPVDLLKPDLQKYPKFADIQPLNCTIGAGDVLYMPSFWWHEVQSRPDRSEHRNLAINFWYEPFLTREFPCPECRLDVNFDYLHLL